MKNDNLILLSDRQNCTQVDVNKKIIDISIDTLSRTLWGEARGEGTVGMRAVASVIWNRYKISKGRNGYWWGNDIVSICHKPYQFSCWNRSDPNYKRLMAVDIQDRQFRSAKDIARLTIEGQMYDLTGGATHYHAKNIKPYWSNGQAPTKTIGNHIFYNLENSP